MPSGQKPVSNRRYERFDVADVALEAYKLGIVSILNSRRNIGIRVVNISECGLQIVIRERLDRGQRLRVAAKVPKVSDVIEGEVVIHWCYANGKDTGEFLAGTEFTSMPNGTVGKIQNLRKFLRSAEFKQFQATQNREAREKRGDEGLEFIHNPNT